MHNILLLSGLRVKVEEKQTDLKERMDDIEIDTTENFDYLQKMDEDYKEMYDVLTGNLRFDSLLVMDIEMNDLSPDYIGC